MSQILAEFKMEHCNAIKTPCPSYHLTSAMCPLNTEQHKVAAQLPFCVAAIGDGEFILDLGGSEIGLCLGVRREEEVIDACG